MPDLQEQEPRNFDHAILLQMQEHGLTPQDAKRLYPVAEGHVLRQVLKEISELEP